MQKIINKIVAIVISFMLVGANFISVGVYATSTINQDATTSEANVEFNATIKNGYSAKADIEEDVKLNITVKVSNTGYLKDGIIALEGNNYAITQTSNENAKAINGNSIELNTVNAGEILNVELPIKINKQDYVSADEFNKDSAITLNATYVNEKGKEKKVSKTLTEHLEWTADVKENIEQTLVRNIKYDDNKTMLSYEIKEGIEENKLPVTNKTINIVVPEINKTKPSKVIVTGDGINYEYKDGTLTINKTNTANSEGKIKWNSADTYMVTYMYDAVATEEKITTSAKASVTTIKGDIVEGQTAVNEYDVKAEVGSIVETSIEGTTEINKGYMYTNINRVENKLDTEYTVAYKTNIGYVDLTDKITITEQSNKFTDENGKEILDATDNITSKKVTISADELTKILGTDGTITVKDTNGTTLGTLNKDTLELNVNTNKLVFETSKPQTEGNLTIKVNKVISGNANYTKSQIQSFKNLDETAIVKGYKENETVSTKNIVKSITFVEPKSNATLTLSSNTLSTVVENKDVIINVALKTSNIGDSLYTNPTIKITMPNEVKSINITDSKLLYDDELTLSNIHAEGNTIVATLNGTQTKYSAQNSDGTLIRIVANITLDNLAPSSESEVTLNYTNAATKEDNTVKSNISIIAPTGFVTTNTLSVNGKSATAQESDAEEIKVDNNSSEKQLNISGTIVNNLGETATGVTVIGRIPFKGNKTIQGIDLGTTVDTTLLDSIKITGTDAQVYYSTDGEATINSTNWTADYSNAKSYKIVLNSEMSDKSLISFDYKVKLPANLDYGNIAKAVYGVYYNNNAKDGKTQNLVESKSVGITTGAIPQLTTKISATDFAEGYAIDDQGTITEGEYITYKVKVTNTGKEDAKNVKVTENLPNELAILNYVKGTSMETVPAYELDRTTKEVTKTVDTIKAGESTIVEFNVANTQIISSIKSKTEDGNTIDIEEAKKLVTNFIVSADKIEQETKTTFTVKNTEGILHIDLVSDAEGKVKENQQIVYAISLKNVNSIPKNNVKINLQLPDGIEYNGTEYKDSYNKTTNKVTINIGTLDSRSSYTVNLNAKVVTDSAKTLTTIATAKCDESADEIKSNSIIFNNEATNNVVSATQTTNISDGTLIDTDDLEFYIDIKNNGNETKTLTLEDILPTELKLATYKIVVDGNEIQKTTGGYVRTSFELAAGKTARATITAKVNSQSKDKTIEIENAPTLTINNGTQIKINSIKLKITGTGIVSSDENSENQETTKGTYKITGTAWFDKNFDGKKELEEEKLSNIKLSVYEKETGSIAKDVNEKELTTISNSEGKYTFVNVKPGNYIVVAEFDNTQYELAPYKVNELSDAENSDFISTQINGKQVFATDTIVVKDSNYYNIDLGLTSKKKFDLSLRKTISKITVTNTKANTKVYNFDSNIAKVELSTKNVEYATVLIEYTIKVTNEGQIAGYAKSIVDYLPEGMQFNSELNNNWYVGKDGNGYNTSLANTIINPGETKEITLVLSKKMTGENTGNVRNTAEILTSYNEQGLADIDSTAGNKQDGEDDISSADSIIMMSTGKEVASFTGITLGILTLIALAVYEIKKHVINKMYNNIL